MSTQPTERTLRVGIDPARRESDIRTHLASPAIGPLTVGEVFAIYRYVEAQWRREYRWYPFKGAI